jgi:hypothetical protein
MNFINNPGLIGLRRGEEMNFIDNAWVNRVKMRIGNEFYRQRPGLIKGSGLV